jgi:hypothetical protein
MPREGRTQPIKPVAAFLEDFDQLATRRHEPSTCASNDAARNIKNFSPTKISTNHLASKLPPLKGSVLLTSVKISRTHTPGVQRVNDNQVSIESDLNSAFAMADGMNPRRAAAEQTDRLRQRDSSF